MIALLLFAAIPLQLWYFVPLWVAISLVSGATRDERMGPILYQSYRAAVWLGCFMLTIFTVLWLLSWLV